MITLHAEPMFDGFAPYPPGPAPVDWQAVADQLATQPGRWAQIGTSDRRSGSYKRCKAYGLQVTRRTNGDGTWAVWARYVGTQPATAAGQVVAHAADTGTFDAWPSDVMAVA